MKNNLIISNLCLIFSLSMLLLGLTSLQPGLYRSFKEIKNSASCYEISLTANDYDYPQYQENAEDGNKVWADPNSESSYGLGKSSILNQITKYSRSQPNYIFTNFNIDFLAEVVVRLVVKLLNEIKIGDANVSYCKEYTSVNFSVGDLSFLLQILSLLGLEKI